MKTLTRGIAAEILYIVTELSFASRAITSKWQFNRSQAKEHLRHGLHGCSEVENRRMALTLSKQMEIYGTQRKE